SVLNVGSAAARCGPRYMNSYSNFAWCEHGFPRTCEEIGQGRAAFAARMPCLDFRPISYQGRDGVSRWRGTTDIANNCCPVPKLYGTEGAKAGKEIGIIPRNFGHPLKLPDSHQGAEMQA